jgi:hypothetical protein
MAFTLAMPLCAIQPAAGFTPASKKTRGGAWSGRVKCTAQSAQSATFSIAGRDVRCRRRQRTRGGMERGVRAVADADADSSATTGGEEASGVVSSAAAVDPPGWQPPPPPPPGAPAESTNVRPATTGFAQRVEAAAAALRSGTSSSQQRRKPQTPSSANAGTATATPAAAAPPEPAPALQPTARDDAPTGSSLLSTSENTDQMVGLALPEGVRLVTWTMLIEPCFDLQNNVVKSANPTKWQRARTGSSSRW